MFTQEEIQYAIHLRHDIHQHPELKYEENRTSKLVEKELRMLGFQVQTGIAGTGVVGLLQSDIPGPCIAFRADMDALPILEKTGLEYASQHDGKMHACGHDGHTATLLLAARWLANHRAELKGTIKLIFQPAEEGGNGAEKMVKEGVLDNPRVEAIFGYHNRPGFPAKLVFVKPNSAMGGNDTFDVTIKGKAGHSAMPSLAIDPIYVAANIVQQTQGLVGRSKSPLKHGVITVSQFHAGSADNIIPEQANIVINIRSDSPESREQLAGRLENLIKGNCLAFGAEYSMVAKHSVPPLCNPPAYADVVLEATKKVMPDHPLQRLDYMPTMGAEDFAFYLEQVPGCFFFVGNGEDCAYLHNEKYNFNDEILSTAAGVFVGLAKHYCGISER
ncbi:M20 metallopeptidase family protein [Pelistega europaea]|uniref:Amidohydrolase n=1 Tax=Pelistega europaea TaxID=106147 RepID=A0A7Y4L820_9BURK|nr:amidohydrolase [Pelistega europaea]NOL48694.1 amidohydrolase [Pelistega europaea]